MTEAKYISADEALKMTEESKRKSKEAELGWIFEMIKNSALGGDTSFPINFNKMQDTDNIIHTLKANGFSVNVLDDELHEISWKL